MEAVQRTLHEIFTCYIFTSTPTLGEVIKVANWGSNKVIHQKGFRVDDTFSLNCPYFKRRVKDSPLVKTPKLFIKNGWAIITPKGTKIIVIKIKE